MAALASSVAPSLASAYAPGNAWLINDTDPTGKVPVTTGPVEPLDNPTDGTAPVELGAAAVGWEEPELAEAAPDYFYSSAFPHAGPWPMLPEEGTGKEPFGTLAPDGITAAGTYRVPPEVEGLAQNRALLPGHDRHSQDTDSAGWEQYTLTGRTAVRQGWRQDHPGVENFWPVTQPTAARIRIARGANQSVGGVIATYGDIESSGGNAAYEPPPPPSTSVVPASSGAAPIPQWGF